MREILFRGKDIDTGEWVEGFLIRTGDVASIVSMKPRKLDMLCSLAQVDAATVGQYTGVDDWRGNKIFEGDVLGYQGATESTWTIEYTDGGFCARHGNTLDALCAVEVEWFSLCKIGNIYDNPESVGVGD